MLSISQRVHFPVQVSWVRPVADGRFSVKIVWLIRPEELNLPSPWLGELVSRSGGLVVTAYKQASPLCWMEGVMIAYMGKIRFRKQK